MRILSGLLGLVLFGSSALAQGASLADCAAFSDDPLNVTVPLCTALIDSPEGLSPHDLAFAYVFRADAYRRGSSDEGTYDERQQRLAAALADLEMAAAIDPARHRERASLLYQLERFAEAAEGFTAAIQAEAVDSTIMSYLLEQRSWALERTGDLAGAIEDMTAAIELSQADLPQLADYLVHRAGLRERAGDIAGAAADYAAALELEPDNSAAQAALDGLNGQAE